MLLTRLLLVTSVISILVAVLITLKESSHVSRIALDRALMRMGILRALALEQLDAPNLGNRAKLQEMLNAIAYKGFDLNTGHHVFFRILDTSFSEIARTGDLNHDNITAIEKYVGSENFRTKRKDLEPKVNHTHIGKGKYVQVLLPILNSKGVVVAYVEGFFATSREEEQSMFIDILREIGLAVGTVVVTALILYPFIVRFMRRFTNLSYRLLDSNLETLRVLGSAIAKRDSDTDIHNFRVTIYSVRIAEALGLDDQTVRILIKGALLHDIGKIGIRDSILLKPGRLDENEFAEMKLHVNHGIDIVNRSSWTMEALPVVASHHEKFDGNGYPAGLKNKDIPILARIFAVADVFDALTSRRPYKEPFGFDKTIGILTEGRGNHFDPEIIDVFLKIARTLFDAYGNKDDDKPRKDLSEIIERYYKVDIAALID